MAKYLDTAQISSELMTLLKEAKQFITLISYSLQVNVQIQERLKMKSSNNVDICIIFGNTELKDCEIEWMREVEDLKLFRKSNLHAKCYLNENKAIISSMNLYEYSQTNNIEMGVLIERDENTTEWENLMDDIANMKHNGEKLNINKFLDNLSIDKTKVVKTDTNKTNSVPSKVEKKSRFTYQQQLKKQLLEKFRKSLSKKAKENERIILSDGMIEGIVTSKNITEIADFLKLHDKSKLQTDIAEILLKSNNYTFGVVVDVKYSESDFKSDRVCIEDLASSEQKWYNTKIEMPSKQSIVAARINEEWFNEYYLLEESSIPYSNEKFSIHENGYCIRCAEKIEYNPSLPYCNKCYTTWKKFADTTYAELYCHCCGKEMPKKTSMEKPLCYSCWKQNNK